MWSDWVKYLHVVTHNDVNDYPCVLITTRVGSRGRVQGMRTYPPPPPRYLRPHYHICHDNAEPNQRGNALNFLVKFSIREWRICIRILVLKELKLSRVEQGYGFSRWTTSTTEYKQDHCFIFFRYWVLKQKFVTGYYDKVLTCLQPAGLSYYKCSKKSKCTVRRVKFSTFCHTLWFPCSS